ncbi:MAG: hypothetical protein R6W90_13195 [Ignavibacteriaceae bacterium]
MKYLFFLICSALILSCSDINISGPYLFPVEESSAGVVSKKYYTDISFVQLLQKEEFVYQNRLLMKKIYYSGNNEAGYRKELFYYSGRRLMYKVNYQDIAAYPGSLVLTDSTLYKYAGDYLSEEKICFFNSNRYLKYTYEYVGKYPIKKSKFYDEELDSYVVYEYSNRKLLKEKIYYRYIGISEIKEYEYKDNFLIGTVFTEPSGAAKRKISYTYNKRGKLILEEVKELLPYSSSMSYVIRYEY